MLEEQGQGARRRQAIVGDPKIAKVSVVGIGMRSHVGIASLMFRTLAEEGINIQMISTSEIKISVVVEDKYMELAVRALHKAFGLEQAPPRRFCALPHGERTKLRACARSMRGFSARSIRRRGREVEGTPLLREHARKNCIDGSNPSVSAITFLTTARTVV